MSVNITGSKYAIRSLTSAGTTSVTIGTGTFVAGDFGATQRMVALFSSANIFKGIAWVRRFTSTTALELENPFVDPITGVYATQVVGDQVLVSKNSAESAAAGWAVTTPDTNIVTVTDNVLMGTSTSEVSLCFYDENKQFTMTNGFRFNGGVAVFGKLLSYDGVNKESFVWSRECTARPNENYPLSGSPAYNLWGTGDPAAHMFFFGGAVGSPMRRSFFIGSEGTGATNKSFAFFGTRLYHACASPSNGGNWSTTDSRHLRHLLYKTLHEADYSNANLIVWGNGVAKPAHLGFPQYGAGSPLGVFRASGAVDIGADANNRTIVADLGSGAFIDDINNGTYVFTNVITPAVNIVRHPGGSTPVTMQFRDDYTNLKPRTTLALQRGDGTAVTSVVNTVSSTFTATAVQAIYNGTANGPATATSTYTTFYYTAKCYGYDVVTGSHATETYSLGTAGTGINLKLGGLINQLESAAVTLTETEALALSSKFSVNVATKTLTVLANATYSESYDFSVAWSCSSAANSFVPDRTRYLMAFTGDKLNLPTGWTLAVNTGVTYTSDSKYSYIYSPTVTINGTGKIAGLYETAAGPSVTVQLKNVSAAGVAAIWHPTTSATELFQTNSTGAAADYTLYFAPGSVGLVKKYARELYGFQRVEGSITLAAGLNVVEFVDIPDVGIANTSQSAVAAYTSIEGPSKRYDRTAVLRLSEQGIKLGQLATRSGTSLEGTYSVVVRDDAPAVMSVLGNVITIKAASYEADDKYDTETITGGGTFTAYDTEVITVEIVDANGDSSLTIQGGSGNNEVWKVVNGTPEDQYATGTLLAATVGTGKWRFTGATGFYLLVRDKAKNNRDTATMEKGTYTIGLYAGKEQISVAQLPEVYELQDDMALVKLLLDAIKGSGFDTTLDSLKAIRTAMDAKPALADIEASTILANKTDVLAVTASVWSAETRTLTGSLATASQVTALGEDVLSIASVVMDLPSAADTASAVRTELSAELGHMDVAVSTRSTLTAQDIPEGLTAAEVWAATDRTLTETPGLTSTQAEQLRKVAQLHGVGAELVVTATSRTAGDVSQTITSTEDQTTVSSA